MDQSSGSTHFRQRSVHPCASRMHMNGEKVGGLDGGNVNCCRNDVKFIGKTFFATPGHVFLEPAAGRREAQLCTRAIYFKTGEKQIGNMSTQRGEETKQVKS